MQALYNIGIQLFGFSIRVASLFNSKAKTWITGRKKLFDQLPNLEGKKVIWFHCASLGEFDQGLPLMNRIKENDKDVFLLVTFFSPSGMKHYHKRNHAADYVGYIPLDTPSNARKMVDRIQPESVFFVKYEFWTNHILAAKKSGAKIYNVSGIFRENHRFFKWYGHFFRSTLKQFDWFFVQNKTSVELLASINISNVTKTGDSRFDKVLENKTKLSKDAILDNFCKNKITFIVGSSWPQDEALLLPIVNSMQDKVIIAPHNVDDKHVKGITDKLNRSYVRFSKIKSDDISDIDVLIMDTIGQLSNAYAYGSYAYVGGGFSGSLHNILEPAVFGLGVIFGPKHSRFPEGQQFIDAGIGFSIKTQSELQESITHVKQHAHEINQAALQLVEANIGASEKIYQHVIAN